MKVKELIQWLSQQDPELNCMVRMNNGDEEWLNKAEPSKGKCIVKITYFDGVDYEEYNKSKEDEWTLEEAIKLCGPKRGPIEYARCKKYKEDYINQPWIDAVIF
jgi:hypothetical protein